MIFNKFTHLYHIFIGLFYHVLLMNSIVFNFLIGFLKNLLLLWYQSMRSELIFFRTIWYLLCLAISCIIYHFWYFLISTCFYSFGYLCILWFSASFSLEHSLDHNISLPVLLIQSIRLDRLSLIFFIDFRLILFPFLKMNLIA